MDDFCRNLLYFLYIPTGDGGHCTSVVTHTHMYINYYVQLPYMYMHTHVYCTIIVYCTFIMYIAYRMYMCIT